MACRRSPVLLLVVREGCRASPKQRKPLHNDTANTLRGALACDASKNRPAGTAEAVKPKGPQCKRVEGVEVECERSERECTTSATRRAGWRLFGSFNKRASNDGRRGRTRTRARVDKLTRERGRADAREGTRCGARNNVAGERNPRAF
jgi:hypothetical protein